MGHLFRTTETQTSSGQPSRNHWMQVDTQLHREVSRLASMNAD